MAGRVIAQDTQVTIYDGGPYVAGGSPTWGAAIPVSAFCKSMKETNKVSTVDLRGFGDVRKKLRPTFGETQVTMDLLIESTGVVPVTPGNWTKVVWAPLGGLSPAVRAGLCTEDNFDATLDNGSTQTVTVDCDSDDV